MNTPPSAPSPLRRTLRNRVCVTALTVLCATTLTARAARLLELVFDDPFQLIGKNPEGISKVTPDFANSYSTLASGSEGRVLPSFTGGPAKGAPPDASMQILTKPPMGKPAFLRMTLKARSATKTIGIGVIPTDAANSLAAIVEPKDGMSRMDGGFDFFLRTGGDGKVPCRFSLWAKGGPLGFNVNKNIATGEKLLLKVFTSGNLIDSDGDKAGDKAALIAKSASDVPWVPGTIYHLAVLCKTSPEGKVTVSVCCQAGLDALDPAKATVATIENFDLQQEPPPKVTDEKTVLPDKINISIAQEDVEQTLDLAEIRIFKPAPVTFPAMGAKD